MLLLCACVVDPQQQEQLTTLVSSLLALTSFVSGLPMAPTDTLRSHCRRIFAAIDEVLVVPQHVIPNADDAEELGGDDEDQRRTQRRPFVEDAYSFDKYNKVPI